MAVCDVLGAGCACQTRGAGGNSIGARRSNNWVDAVADMGVRGAGILVTDQVLPGSAQDLAMQASELKAWGDVPEQAWPTGTVAVLAEPYTVDRGAYADAKQVTRFVKKSSGRWFSDPGADVSFASLFELSGRAVIAEVNVPFGAPDPQPKPEPERTAAAPKTASDGLPDVDTDPVPDAPDAQGDGLPVHDGMAEAMPSVQRGLVIAGGVFAAATVLGLGAWLLLRKKRR